MGRQVKVKKLNAVNFIRGTQINYCLAIQAVRGLIFSKLIFYLPGSKKLENIF